MELKRWVRRGILSTLVGCMMVQTVSAAAEVSKTRVWEFYNEVGPYYNTDLYSEVEETIEEETSEEVILEVEEVQEEKIEMSRFFTAEEKAEEDDFIFLEGVSEVASIFESISQPELKKLVISKEVVNVEVENQWIPIDTQLEMSRARGTEGAFVNTENTIQSLLGSTVNDGLVFHRQTGEVSLFYRLTQEGDKESEGSQLIYPLEGNRYLKVEVEPSLVKQRLIFLSQPTQNSVEVEIKVKDSDPRDLGDRLRIDKPGINIPVMDLLDPILVDQEGTEGVVERQFKDGVLTYTMDSSFLETAIYPVTLTTRIETVDHSVSTYAHMGLDTSVSYNFSTSTLSNISMDDLAYYGWVLPPNRHYEAFLYLGNNPYTIEGSQVKDSYSFYQLPDGTLDAYGLRGKYIKEATLKLPIKEMSAEAEVIGCTIQSSYDITKATYNNLETPLKNSDCVSTQRLRNGDRHAEIDVTHYVKGVIEQDRENYGVLLLLKDQNSSYVTVHAGEYYYVDKNSGSFPTVEIFYYEQPDVQEMELSDFDFKLRPFTKYKYETGLAHFTVFGIDGIAPLGATVKLSIQNRETENQVKESQLKVSDNFNLYPKYPEVENTQQYASGASNYQFPEFYGNSGAENQDVFEYNKVYDVLVEATQDGESEKRSTWFQLYEVKSFDVVSSIATFYGVELEVLLKDNNLQDHLVVEDNVLFIREPTRNLGVEYKSDDLSEDVKKEIDASLSGRGLQCEFGFEPINFNTGNFLFETVDASFFNGTEKVEVGRVYNSKNASHLGSFGYGWSNSLLYQVTFNIDQSVVEVSLPDGKRYLFRKDASGNYINSLSKEISLKKENDRFVFETKEERFEFRRDGNLDKIVNHQKEETNFYYDDLGRLKVIDYSKGVELQLHYNQDNLISSISLPDGSQVNYEYKNLTLVSFIDQSEKSVSYQYNEKNEMIEWTNRKGEMVIQNEYDDNHRVIRQIDGLGNIFTLVYEDDQTVITDGEGNQEIITYDEFGQTTSRKTSNGFGKEMQFSQGQLIKEILATGIEVNYTYDGANLVKVERSDGIIETIVYDENNNPIEYRKGDEVKTFVYDDNNRVTSVSDSLGNKIQREYNAEGQLIQEISPSGAMVSYEYDELGRKKKISHSNGDFLEYTYNELGLIISEKDSYGQVKEYTHSERGELIRIDYADGTYETREFDVSGNLIKERDRDGNIIQKQYNLYANVIEEIDGLGNKVTYIYDKNQRLIQTNYSNGTVTKQVLDELGRVIETESNGRVSKTFYNELGQVETLIDERGNKTRYVYDESGNIIETHNSDGTKEVSVYNNHNQVIKRVDALGNITEYEYDLNGKVIQEKTERSITEINYNALGKEIQRTITTKDSVQVTKKEYNTNGQLIAEIDPFGNKKTYEYSQGQLIATVDERGNKITYSYDLDGKVNQKKYADGSIETFLYDGRGNLLETINRNGHKTSFTFDSNNNQTSVTYHLEDGRKSITTYTYNSQGQIVKEVSPEGLVSEYLYNVDSRLIEVKKDGKVQSTFIYNEIGDLESETVNGVKTTYIYDSLGRRIKDISATGIESERVYNNLNQVTQVKENGIVIQTFSYDRWGQVDSVVDQFGVKKEYTYDHVGNVIQLKQTNQPIKTYEYDETGTRLIEEKDTLGNTRKTTYDEIGNVILQEINGKSQTKEYNQEGRLISVTDALGNKTSYTYDSLGNQIRVTNALGIVTETTYNAMNQVVETKVNDIVQSKMKYNLEGQVIVEEDALGNKVQFKFDLFGQVILKVDKRGYATEYTYDDHHNLISEKDALGNVTRYEFDALNQQIALIDARGNRTENRYDALGNVIEVMFADKSKETKEYNEYNQLASETDSKGLKTELVYDNYGRIYQTIENDRVIEEITYDDYGRVIKVKDILGNTHQKVYDKENQLIQEIDPLGNQTITEYDALGQVVKTTMGSWETEIVYDGLGRTVKEVVNGERVTTRVYDAFGNKVEEEVNGQKTVIIYDANHQEIETKDALGNSLKYEYNENGQVIAKIEANGAKTEFIYDGLGRQIQVKSPLGNINTSQYDSVGNVIRVQNAKGAWFDYTYDKMNRLIKEENGVTEKKIFYNNQGLIERVRYEDGKDEVYRYDVYGNLVTLTQKDGSEIRYTYDEVGNLLSKNNVIYRYDEFGRQVEIENQDSLIKKTYDTLGNVVSVNQDGKEIKYTYDHFYQLQEIIYPDGTKVNYTYDQKGNLSSVTTPYEVIAYEVDAINQVVKEVSNQGIEVIRSYDEVGSIKSLKTKVNGVEVTSYTYEYNLEGSVIKEIRHEQGQTTTLDYKYNKNDELIQTITTTEEGIETLDYTISITGNRAEMVSGKRKLVNEYNDYNQLIKTYDGKYSYELRYDDKGNRIEEKRSDGKIKTYTYDDFNQLIEVRDFDGVTLVYRYDGLGNRIEQTASQTKTISYQETVTGKESIRALIKKVEYLRDSQYCEVNSYFIQRKTKETEEVVDRIHTYTDRVSITYINDITQEYTQVLSKIQDGKINHEYYGIGRVSNDKIRYTYDGYGNVTQLLSHTGGLQELYEYTSYGKRNIAYDPFLQNNEYGYRSEAHTKDNHQYLRARYYDTEKQIFLQEDTYQGEVDNPTSKNKYLYALNNPLKYSDPSGHMSIWKPGSVIGLQKPEYRGGRYPKERLMYRMTKKSPWIAYSGNYMGRRYVNGFMFSGRDGYSVYKDGILVHRIKNGWYGNNFYKDDILMYSRFPSINGQAPPDFFGQPGSNGGINTGASTGPKFSNGTNIPVIQIETPRIDRTKVTNETKRLIEKAAISQGISYKAMEEQLYSQLMAEGSGLDFPKFVNQQHLESRIQEMCNKIIDDNLQASGNALLNGFQEILDWIGFIPGIGDVFDAVNAVIYAARGMYVMALISVACVIFSIYADVILKPIKKVVNTVSDLIVKVAPDIPDFVQGMKIGFTRVIKKAKEWVGKFFSKLLEPFAKATDNFSKWFADVFGKTTEESIENTLKPKNFLDDLASSGVRYTPDDVLMVTKTPDGKLMWLETGNNLAGLEHIVERHAGDFSAKGIDDITGFLKEIIEGNTPINIIIDPNRGPVADYLVNGSQYRVVYGNNGFIVSFFPKK